MSNPLAKRIRWLFGTIDKLVFIRHGNTAPVPNAQNLDPDEADRLRVLSEKGKQQCEAARKKWFSKLNLSTIYFSSPAKRVHQTADLLFENSKLYKRIDIPKLYLGFNEEGKQYMRKLTYSPLETYFQAGAKECYIEYADSVLQEILDELEKCDKKLYEKKVLPVFCHAVIANLFALRVAEFMGIKDTEKVMKSNLGEVEGILVSPTSITMLQ